jgi:CRP/FNR family cyclic AMP-dependent transcriptional regulator
MSLRRGRVLEFDPDLGAALHSDAFSQARERVTAQVIPVDPRRGRGPADLLEADDQLGVLVVQGVLLQRLRLAGRNTVDLVGPGDVIRPWPTVDEYAELFAASHWQVLPPVALLGLDRRFLREASSWPELLIALSERSARHARSLALRLAISQIPLLVSRVRVMLWHLAERFGRVDREGILIPLRLSHEVIAELVSARRETVSRGLKALAERDMVVPVHGGWRLCGSPPSELVISPLSRTSHDAGQRRAAGHR